MPTPDVLMPGGHSGGSGSSGDEVGDGPEGGSVWQSAAVKAAGIPVTALATLLTARVIVGDLGPAAYAQYGLLVSLAALVPFADLGMSAALINVLAGPPSPDRDDEILATLRSVFRVLSVAAVTILAGAAAIAAFGSWSTVLGDGLITERGDVVVLACVALFAVSLVLGPGERVLVGLGRNRLRLLLTSGRAPAILVGLLVVRWFVPRYGDLAPVVAYAGGLLVSASLLIAAVRSPAGRAIKLAMRDLPRRRTRPGLSVRSTAIPMFVQMVALPLAVQTDRLVLSHGGTVDELASYTLASQLFLPIWQVGGAAGMALWPRFAKARAVGNAVDPASLALAFAGAGVLAAVATGFAAPLVGRMISGTSIALPTGLVCAFAVFVVVQVAKVPYGMYLTDSAGLRFQAIMVSLMLPVNLGLSLALVGPIGAAGPVVGSVVGVLVFQVIANAVYVRRAARA